MPIVRIDLLPGRSQEAKQKVATGVTELISRELGTDPAHIYVIFNEVAREDWAVGGKFFPSPVNAATSEQGPA